MQVVLLAPHPLQARAEVLVQQLAPSLAFDAPPAPVQLEQHVRIEVAVDLVEIDLDLFARPRTAGSGTARRSRAGERTESSARLSSSTGSSPFARNAVGARAQLLDERRVGVRVDQLVHHREPLERVLAVEHARLIDLLGLLAAGIQRAVGRTRG